MHLLIKNGFLVDGTGSPAIRSDLLIKDDKIIEIKQNIDSNGAKVIDARDKVVCPGFIDLHNHADLTILEATDAEAFIAQGMTTILVSLCGIGVSPANKKVKDYYLNFVNKAFCSSPELYDHLNDFFNEIEKRGISINLAFLIPQGNVRACVLGTETRPATDLELAEMKRIVKENMEAGAFGLSTGLVYPPGSVTSTEELIELSKMVSQFDGIYDSHMRNEGAGVIDIGMKELIRIAQEANVRAHISHWSVISQYKYEELTKKAIELVNKSREQGLEITADVVVYNDGFTSLSFVLLPTWVYNDFKGNLTNSETRKKIKNEIFAKLYSMFLSDAPLKMKVIPKFLLRKKIIPVLSKGVIIIYALNNHKVEGKTLYDALTILYPYKNLEDALLDYILDEEGGIMIRIQQKNEKKSVIPLFLQKYVVPSSDAILIIGGNTHPRAYGAFPRAIARWVREQEIISLEEMIKKMTSLPASILKLKDRGIIKEGYKADLVIFDPETINEKGTLENGCKEPEGIEYVIVNGEITFANCQHTGALNGQILKHHAKI
ncbi:MAG: D-aminoacylase [Candidatus Lokiarchaeota archaeon]|nr:D-aminoacylase [Candidatus Lokiarchaeota archaeon]